MKTDIQINGENRKPRGTSSPIQSDDFQQCGKTIQWGKDSHFNKWCWGNWIPTCKNE